MTNGIIFRAIFLTLMMLSAAALAADYDLPARYFQQDVSYKIEIELADDLRTITGEMEIEYLNNSPDTLSVIYLKAFPNAIQPGSYADLKNRTVKNWSLADIKPERQGRSEIHRVTRNGSDLEIETDNTIVTVGLTRPIGPGETAEFRIEFTIVLPSPAKMRMGFSGGVTKAVYWFPALCVYDWKLGWVNSQYLGAGEWYGDYSSFDVKITAPEDQIVAATGVCVNESEMIPADYRAKLDIANFLKPRSEWPKFEFDSDNKKTWHYVAENVPDFVFTSSSQWCIDSDSIDAVEVIAYPLRRNAAKWTEAVRLGKESVVTHGENFIPYQWPVVRICDAYGGMEYPMLTNCSNRRGPDSKFFAMLIYHEVGHFWFMGHIGTNQTDRPSLDEGFTTHAEHLAMEKYLGRLGNYEHFDKWYEKKFYPQSEDRNIRGFRPLLMLMKDGYDKEMIFSYDQGEEYWPFRVSAYYKTAAMHYSLRSILGDSLYFVGMQYYCKKWLFKHPYEDDFAEAMEDATGVELTEYLRQWFHLRDRLDYSLAGKKSVEEPDGWAHTIKLERPGDFVAPIDVAVIWEQGDTTIYTVAPEGMAYAKPGAVLLPTWNQFKRLSREYEFTARAKRKIDKIVIDPDNLLMDINRLNNESGFFPPIELRLDNMIYDRPPLHKYAWRLRPDLWFDNPNGLQFGVHSHGAHLEDIDRHDIEARYGFESALPFVDVQISTHFAPFGRNSMSYNRVIRADRRTFFSAGVTKRFKKYYSVIDQEFFLIEFNDFSFDNRSSGRGVRYAEAEDLEYFDSPYWFATNTTTIKAKVIALRTFRHGRYRWETSSTQGLFKEDQVHYGFNVARMAFDLSLNLPLESQLDLTLAMGTVLGNPPPQYMPHLSRRPSVDVFTESSIFRSPGTFPTDWQSDFYLATEGVRGYQDRAIFYTDCRFVSLELTPPSLLPYSWFRKLPLVGKFLSKTTQSFFVTGASVRFKENLRYGMPGNELAESDDYTNYISAGLSLNFPSVWKGQTYRIDFPLYLNKPLPGDEEFEFRFSVAWILPGYFD